MTPDKNPSQPSPNAKIDELVSDLGAEVAATLVQALFDDAPETFSQLRTHFAEGDLGSVRRIAHSFKSSGYVYGLGHVGDLAASVENAAAEGLSAELPTLLDELESNYNKGAAELITYLSTRHQIQASLP